MNLRNSFLKSSINKVVKQLEKRSSRHHMAIHQVCEEAEKVSGIGPPKQEGDR